MCLYLHYIYIYAYMGISAVKHGKYSVNIDTFVWIMLLRIVSIQASNANKGEGLSFRSFLLWYLRLSEVLEFLTLKLDEISRRKVVCTILYSKKYLIFKTERIIWMLAPWGFFFFNSLKHSQPSSHFVTHRMCPLNTYRMNHSLTILTKSYFYISRGRRLQKKNSQYVWAVALNYSPNNKSSFMMSNLINPTKNVY